MNFDYVRPWLAAVARLVLGALFLWSGLSRLSDPRAVLRGVVAYDATPDWLSRVIAFGLPTLELCIALMLIVGILTRIAAAVAGVLQVIFLVGVIELAARGIKIDVGAFSAGGVTTHATRYLLFGLLNVVLIVLAAGLVRWPLTQLSVDEFLARAEYVEVPSAKRLRSEQGRRKYEADVAQARAHTRERNRYVMAGLVVPVVLIAFIAVGVQAKRANPTAGSTVTASHVDGVSIGLDTATVNVDVFEDFQSPASMKLEQSLGADFNSIAATTNRQVRFHMVAIWDASSNGNRYSSRAANAAICASDLSSGAFRKYQSFLFGKDGNGAQIMPAIGSHGRTDTSLISYAKDALGIGNTDLSTFQTCVQSEEHKGLVEATTQNFTNRGYSNVPVVLVNGVKLKTLTVDALNKAVAAAAVKSPPKPVASSSASASATASSTASGTGLPLVPASSSAVVSTPATATTSP